jgi:helix-turn-helix protein
VKHCDVRRGQDRPTQRKPVRRRPNPRLAKIHRSYTVDEVARLFDLHRNSVRQWIKKGLPVIGGKRPLLIHGRDLRSYLEARRQQNKRTYRPGQIYCMRCRAPKRPATDWVEYKPLTESMGNLVGICPDCDAIINRGVSLAKLGQVRGSLDITFPPALRDIGESPNPSVNSDLP